MREPDFLLFASDATMLGIAGAALLAVSLAAWLGERKRHRRKAIDAVGWVPWSTLGFVAFFCGALLMAMAGMGWIRG